MPENKPSVRLFREVENIEQEHADRLYELADTHQLQPLAVNELPLKIDVIGQGEVRRFHDITDVTLTDDDAIDLGDYLLEHLPKSADKTLTLPTWPHGILELRRTGADKRTVFCVASADRKIKFERYMAKKLIKRFNKIDVNLNDVWKDDRLPAVQVARHTGPEGIDVLNRLGTILQKEVEILPDKIEFGPLIIEDV